MHDGKIGMVSTPSFHADKSAISITTTIIIDAMSLPEDNITIIIYKREDTLKKTRVYLGIAQMGGGVKSFNLKPLPKWFVTLFQWIQTNLPEAPFSLYFINIYHDFHQNDILESCLTKVTVKIFIPNAKIAI